MHVDPKTKTYEFETPDQLAAMNFCKILDIECVSYNEEIVPSYIGSSYVKFWCNPKTRIIVEYIYRRYCKLDRSYFINLDRYQERSKKLWRDRYAIY